MYRGTEDKISSQAFLLWELHRSGNSKHLYHLFDEPYQLALAIMDFPRSASDEDIARALGINIHTAHRIRYLIGH